MWYFVILCVIIRYCGVHFANMWFFVVLVLCRSVSLCVVVCRPGSSAIYHTCACGRCVGVCVYVCALGRVLVCALVCVCVCV